MSFDWKQTLGTVAPGLATMFGGPLAGMATTAVMGYFGIESTGDSAQDEDLLSRAVMGMSPADAVELKKVEANFAIEMKKADVDIYKVEVDDRKSARTMREKLGGDWLLATLAIAVVGGWIYIQHILFSAVAELPNEAILNRTLGTLDVSLVLVLSFFFGSSSGSRKKDQAKNS